ncbi:hypothetical protein [Salarchaeum japonicum]|uniref:PGF-CTERM sorting domain-containing protein n=1 Tax=Salarchaeum japonicum TaxID=555573 RepID=A0AAV3SYL8_9EURY|nr:hypothetical protein [Salarchaeum japonicum]
MGIFEIHFHDSEFTPIANFGPAEDEDGSVFDAEPSFDADEETETGSSGSAVVPALVALAVLAGVAFAVKKLLN